MMPLTYKPCKRKKKKSHKMSLSFSRPCEFSYTFKPLSSKFINSLFQCYSPQHKRREIWYPGHPKTLWPPQHLQKADSLPTSVGIHTRQGHKKHHCISQLTFTAYTCVLRAMSTIIDPLDYFLFSINSLSFRTALKKKKK